MSKTERFWAILGAVGRGLWWCFRHPKETAASLIISFFLLTLFVSIFSENLANEIFGRVLYTIGVPVIISIALYMIIAGKKPGKKKD